jgi:hypothetical protein
MQAIAVRRRQAAAEQPVQEGDEQRHASGTRIERAQAGSAPHSQPRAIRPASIVPQKITAVEAPLRASSLAVQLDQMHCCKTSWKCALQPRSFHHNIVLNRV